VNICDINGIRHLSFLHFEHTYFSAVIIAKRATHVYVALSFIKNEYINHLQILLFLKGHPLCILEFRGAMKRNYKNARLANVFMYLLPLSIWRQHSSMRAVLAVQLLAFDIVYHHYILCFCI
jgi:hypothetical protein